MRRAEVARRGSAILAILIFGGPEARPQSLIWSHVGPSGSFFGWSIAARSDSAGDGVPDLIAGAHGWSNGAGRVVLLSGTDGAMMLSIVGPSPNAELGRSVADAGDVTGDGVSDIGVGASGLGARLYSGSDGVLIQAWSAGWLVAAPGDVNGDGVPDLVAGLPLFPVSPLGSPIGSASVFSGSTGALLWSQTGTFPSGLFGHPGTVGDLDGDGVREVLIGAPGNSMLIYGIAGHAYVFSGATGALMGELQGPQQPYDSFGAALTGLGDVTGDGVPDVAGTTFNSGGSWALQARVFSGADLSVVTIVGATSANDALGTAIADPGDVDGDGVPDLLAGNHGAPPLVPNVGAAGKATVVYGSQRSVLNEGQPPAND